MNLLRKVANALGWIHSDRGRQLPPPEKKAWEDERLIKFLNEYPYMSAMKNFKILELFNEIHALRAENASLKAKNAELLRKSGNSNQYNQFAELGGGVSEEKT